jgi:hypothetical protein
LAAQSSNARAPSTPGPGNAQIDELCAPKSQVAVRRGERIPLESGIGDEDLALGVAGRAGGGADLIAGFDREQRLVAVNDVQRTEIPGEMCGELGRPELHRGRGLDRRGSGQATGFFADCRRRTMSCTASSCMSRHNRCSS